MLVHQHLRHKARRAASLGLLGLTALLGGCHAAILDPAGDVAARERDLIVQSFWLMMVIIVPVILLTILFAWHYRASNKDANYDPNFDHSTQLELVIWSAPLLIIICLGAITWLGTHTLDPYRPLQRLDTTSRADFAAKPLEVDVVSMDWKWLFFYPEYGIATVNQLAAPLGRPIHFKLTSTEIMNAFEIPNIAGMVYTMPAMQTQLHAVVNRPGVYAGFSSNYSGAGFSEMNFRVYGMPEPMFDRWVAQVRASPERLDRANYLILQKPSIKVPPRHFGWYEPGLFQRILTRCVTPGGQCMMDGMKANPLVAGTMATGGKPTSFSEVGAKPAPAATTPLHGAGLPPPKVNKPSPAASPLLNVM